MLWNSSAINGYAIQATDGNIGTVSDMLFEDTSWAVRWLVVDTGNWLPGRKVLLPLSALGQPDRELRMFPVKLTKQQVKDSPDIDTDKSVSRQHETHIYDYYDFDPYWGSGLYPVSNAMAVPFLAPLPTDDKLQATFTDTIVRSDDDNPHLRSIAAVTGYHIHASDGEIGHAAEFLVDASDWTIRYITVDTRNWWPGQQVLISPRSILNINWADRLIDLDINRETVKGSPPYQRSMTVDGAYDERFDSYYALGYPML